MDEIKCPHCQQVIYDEDALNCLYCGESLNRAIGVLSFIQSKAIIVFIGLIVLISFIFLILF
ncbi:MAG: hypothetical protein KKD05_08480 [Candidatus Omnitrophica bacterium]|nr:hypothetical protein [Candidatus Omnitrophota bacterium]